MSAHKRILVGNSFPLSLVRQPLSIWPRTAEEWSKTLAAANGVASFWGHSNTLQAASQWAGIDLTAPSPRPALVLDPDGYPSLDGESFSNCWVLSPDYAPGFRPQEGQVVPPEAILGWQALEIIWE